FIRLFVCPCHHGGRPIKSIMPKCVFVFVCVCFCLCVYVCVCAQTLLRYLTSWPSLLICVHTALSAPHTHTHTHTHTRSHIETHTPQYILYISLLLCAL